MDGVALHSRVGPQGQAETHRPLKVLPWSMTPVMKVMRMVVVMLKMMRMDGSVNPVNRYPLRLCAQLLHSRLKFLKSLIQIIVHYCQVKVMVVRPFDPGTLVHCFL